MTEKKPIKLWDKYFECYITQQQIQSRVAELAMQIENDYKGRRPMFIAILNGSFMFAADLLRHIQISCEINFVKLSSYKDTESTGKVERLLGLNSDLFGRHIILLEDIVETGLTLSVVFEDLYNKEPISIRSASLLYKPNKNKFATQPDYVGFEIPESFVVGYGLDYNGLGRNLPDIYKVKQH